jgi:hypothetical protein
VGSFTTVSVPDEQDIDLIFGRVAHPQTQGKVERFHRTLARSMIKQGLPTQWDQWQGRYDGFLGRYNYIRPHEALGLQTPAQRYRRSERSYQAQIVPWDYPPPLARVRVDANVMIRWEGGRYFVCEALVHHQVAVEPIGRGLLVRFRTMFIRQIDLQTKRSSAFIHPTTDPI